MSTSLIRRSPIHTGQVVAAGLVTPRMRRVTVRSGALIGLSIVPGQDVELHLRDFSGRRVKRRYTIRALRAERGEMDLDIAQHGPGPGAFWGASAVVGEQVWFQGPRGTMQIPHAPVHLLVGDESSLPAIAAIAESLPAGERAVAVIEVADSAEQQPVKADPLRWVFRAEALSTQMLVPVVQQVLPSLDVNVTRAYLLGETRTMVSIRALLEYSGFPHGAIFLKGYWNRSRQITNAIELLSHG